MSLSVVRFGGYAIEFKELRRCSERFVKLLLSACGTGVKTCVSIVGPINSLCFLPELCRGGF